MEALGLDNIFGAQEIDSLFDEPETSSAAAEETGAEEQPSEKENIETKKETTEVVNPDDLFEDGDAKQPEGVGSEKKQGDKGDAATEKDNGTSPQNFYSSIANALAVDGIFPNLDEETVMKADSAEALSELIDAEVKARYDEGQRRILQALENGVEPDSIKAYENTLNRLASIKESDLISENSESEQLRYQLITQDYMNKGYSREKADKMARRSIDSGNDIEDAKEALQSNKDFFQDQYNNLLEDAQKEADKQKADRVKQEEKLKKSILEDKDLMGAMELGKDIRKKVYDNISRPIYKNPETGQYMTALQKYEMEHHEDFIKYVGLFMTLTDGFKDFKSFTKAEVKKEMKKGLRELEQTLQNTRRAADGSLNLVGSRKSDPESFLEGGFRLAL